MLVTPQVVVRGSGRAALERHDHGTIRVYASIKYSNRLEFSHPRCCDDNDVIQEITVLS